MSFDQTWCTKSIKDIYNYFNVQDSGLTSADVKDNREKYGSNILITKKKVTLFGIFLSQFKNAFIYILIIAGLIVLVLGEYVDGIIIIFVVLLNAVIGTVQEGKAQNTLEALKKVVKSYATVLRNGEQEIIIDEELVPGDIIIFKDGDVVTADARLIEVNRLKVNQSALTGESVPVIKNISSIIDKKTPVADQDNMVFKGTYIISGIAKAVVVGTGVNTAIGEIATTLEDLETEMPLERSIRNLSKVLVIVISVVVVTLFFIGILRGQDTVSMFLTVVAVAVSVIPESLPVVVTLVLTAGVFRMSKNNALVKRMNAAESLGQARILALDKTGTITRNQMEVSRIFVDNQIYDVTGSGYDSTGEVMLDGEPVSLTVSPTMNLFGKVLAFTAEAEIKFDEETKEWDRVSGDPTEAATKVFSEKIGLIKHDLERHYPQMLEIPFDFKTKHHSSVNNMDGKAMLSVTGSPEVLLNWSEHLYHQGDINKLDQKKKDNIEKAIKKLSDQGFRVLACAVNFHLPHDLSKIDPNNLNGLTFIGLVGIKDAIRPQVYDAIRNVHSAGLKAVMITGDHKDTAEAIGREIGLHCDGQFILTGKEIEDLSDAELKNTIENITIFARVSPHHKLRIIQAYKDRGEVIAMTGDGINDALSLTAADLGVSMGKSGTEVAREASDIILLDDNFDNITLAVLEGRNIYATIEKTILYLLATNLGELLVIAIAVIMGWTLPLLATQIIWINMVTDTFLVAALAMEPRDNSLMKKRLRKPSKWIINKTMALRILLVSGVMSIGTLILFFHFLPQGLPKAWTVSLTVLTAFQWYNIFNVRSESKSIFSLSSFKNVYLLSGLVLVIILQLLAVYTPFMQKILHTTSLSLHEWGIILAVAFSVVVVEEIRKLFVRFRKLVV